MTKTTATASHRSSSLEAEKGTTMNKTALTALFAPSVVFLLVLAFFVGSHAGANGVSHLSVGNAHCDQHALSTHHEWGYLSFAAAEHSLQTTVSATEFAGASPVFSSFRVIQGTLEPGLNEVVASAEVGFEAVHAYTHLSETIDYYWNTFVGLGYTPTIVAFNPERMEYVFSNGVSQYRAVFSMVDDDTTVSFTPVAKLFASR